VRRRLRGTIGAAVAVESMLGALSSSVVTLLKADTCSNIAEDKYSLVVGRSATHNNNVVVVAKGIPEHWRQACVESGNVLPQWQHYDLESGA